MAVVYVCFESLTVLTNLLMDRKLMNNDQMDKYNGKIVLVFKSLEICHLVIFEVFLLSQILLRALTVTSHL